MLIDLDMKVRGLLFVEIRKHRALLKHVFRKLLQ
jgi:hypothetical protein